MIILHFVKVAPRLLIPV